MYRVTVTTHVANDRDELRLVAPLLIWLVLFVIIKLLSDLRIEQTESNCKI